MKKLRLILNALLLSGVTYGCVAFHVLGKTTANRVKAFQKPVFENRIVKTPEIGTISIANVGDSIIGSYKVLVKPVLILNDNIIYAGKWKSRENPFEFLKGTYQLTGEKPSGKLFSNVFLAAPGYYNPGVFISNEKPDFLSIVWFHGGRIYIEPPFKPDFDYRVIETVDRTVNNVVRDLVYTGKSGNTISIVYRELIDNKARPAFDLEVKYDLTKTNLIGYKNAKFEILESDNLSIRYKALSHFQ